ncbi:hypothetical protein L0156_08435 [bacterium]|nr:hypothetical protein [bacterium]
MSNKERVCVFLIALMIQVPLMVLAGVRNPDQINPDAIAYLRVAQNYLHGNYHFAVNGYWGPLFSWLTVPVLPLVNDPVTAFRLVDWISAVIFLIGGINVLQTLRFDRITVAVGGILIALFSIQWSIFFIGPDLLMSGLLLVALSYTLASDNAGTGRRPFVAGLFYGAAYLAKAVALPIALLSMICIATIRVLAGITSFRSALYMVGRSALGLALLVIPWFLVLSLHYGNPTFSTSAPLNHALVGPHNPNWFHPSSAVFNVPERGRITTWEDPTVLQNHPLYARWSPFSSWSNLKYQIKLMFGNARLQFHYLKEFDRFGFGIVSAILGFLFFRPWVRSFQTHPWRFGGIAIASMTFIYLPVYSAAPRYFLACYPFLFVVTFGLLTVLAGAIYSQFRNKASDRPAWIRKFALILTTLLLGYGLSEPLKRSLTTRGYDEAPYSVARKMASSLPFQGPVAAVGDGRRVALYLAFLTEQPYYGIKLDVNVSVGELHKTGAAFVIVSRGIPTDQALSKDPSVQLLALQAQDDDGGRERVYCLRCVSIMK